MHPSTFFSLVWRELRGGRARAVVFALCVAIGVAAVTLVAGLAQGLDRGIRREAKQGRS